MILTSEASGGVLTFHREDVVCVRQSVAPATSEVWLRGVGGSLSVTEGVAAEVRAWMTKAPEVLVEAEAEVVVPARKKRAR